MRPHDRRAAPYGFIGATLLAILAGSIYGLGALPKGNDIDGDAPAFCDPVADIDFALRQNQLPLTETEVDITAAGAKITARVPRVEAPATCSTVLHPLRTGEFSWELVERPAGSSAALAQTTTLTARLALDVEGTYRVRFIACPNGCSVALSNGGEFPVSAESRDLLIEAVDEINLPPDTEPVRVPTAPPGFDGEPGCQFADDLINPAWVTVQPWHGPEDYRLLEGPVVKSSVSRTDNNLNHHTNDSNVFVKPDLAYASLYAPGKPEMEVEWETGSYPEAMRPTRGDRISVWGYWINDCAHGARTEIHPPVLTAVHRARAIRLPSSFGTNVFVPGIVTDVWASRDGGEATGDCSLTGLHQPDGGSGLDFGPHSCIPHTAGFAGARPNPLRRDSPYTFTVYLPRDPREIAAEAGLEDAPEVPLSFRVERRNGEPATDGLVSVSRIDLETGTALEVSVDLSGVESPDFYRRIVAGWAYAAPDNWGLRRWKVRVRSLDVHNDGDGRLRGDGDWRFWFNTTSVSQEWAKLFDCDGCVHGLEDFGGVPWETDAGNPARNLGSDLLLYPEQRIFVNATGYEKDWNWEDATGQVTRIHPQQARSYASRSHCRRAGQSGCGSYTMHYDVIERPAIGPVTLSAAARRLYDAYAIGGGRDIPGRVIRDWDLPEEIVLESEQEPVPLDLAAHYMLQEAEPTSLGDITVEGFVSSIEQARSLAPETLEAFLSELRAEVDEGLREGPFPDVLADVAVLRDALPTDLWDRHFADVDLRDAPGANTGIWIAALLLALLLGFVLGRRVGSA